MFLTFQNVVDDIEKEADFDDEVLHNISTIGLTFSMFGINYESLFFIINHDRRMRLKLNWTLTTQE